MNNSIIELKKSSTGESAHCYIKKIDFEKEELVCVCGHVEELMEVYITSCPCCSELTFHCNVCNNQPSVPKEMEEQLRNTTGIL